MNVDTVSRRFSGEGNFRNVLGGLLEKYDLNSPQYADIVAARENVGGIDFAVQSPSGKAVYSFRQEGALLVVSVAGPSHLSLDAHLGSLTEIVSLHGFKPAGSQKTVRGQGVQALAAGVTLSQLYQIWAGEAR